MIWGETGRPGYGLYDRALGAAYLQGFWEAIEKEGARQTGGIQFTPCLRSVSYVLRPAIPVVHRNPL
jgi:hypothetical protein